MRYPPRPVAWIQVDPDGRVRAASGSLEELVGHAISAGERARDALPFLPEADGRPWACSDLSVLPDRYFDVVATPSGDGTLLCLVDQTDRARARQKIQQSRNELELRRAALSKRVEVYEEVLTREDVTVFVHRGGTRFEWVGPARAWARSFLGPGTETGAVVDLAERSELLAALISLSAELASPEVFESLPFQEGEGPVLRATLFPPGERSMVLALRCPADGPDAGPGGSSWLQDARELSLEHLRLSAWVEERDLLLHCIVHDLSGPLGNVTMALSALREEGLPPEARDQLLAHAIRQAERQTAMIRAVDDIFSLDREVDRTRPVELSPILEEAREALQSAWPRVSFSVEAAVSGWAAVDRDRLLRVSTNLGDNAARHAGPSRRVRFRLGPGRILGSDRALRVEVHDGGRGVDPRLGDEVFVEGFRGDRRGRRGLGLTYCKITVERYGGVIGHEPSPDGGASFWFELPRCPPDPR